MQRMYYYEKKDVLYISSEAKSLLKICPELRETVTENLGQLFSMGCVLGNDTIFKQVYLLPGASLWKFKAGSCYKKSCYFDRDAWENQSPLKLEFIISITY